MALKDILLQSKFVTVGSNSGIFEVLSAGESDPNILILKSLGSGISGKFAIMSRGRQRVFPASEQVLKELGLQKEIKEEKQSQLNKVFADVEDIKLYDSRPKIEQKKRGRKSKDSLEVE